MKTYFLAAFVSFLGNVVAPASAQRVTLTPLWETDTTLRTPESVLYSPAQKVIYVSCINGQPAADNKSSYIAKVGLNGKVITPRFTENLNATKGMGILGDKLYVTELTNVVEIALATGKILKRYAVPEAKFLNDIAVDTRSRTLYVTDMRSNRVWALTNGALTVVLDGAPLQSPNGLLLHNGQLLIGNGDGTLLAMNPATKQTKTLAKGMGGIDGIAAVNGQTYIVSEWGGKVWYVRADGTPELKLDTTSEKINSADLDYNPDGRVLYVPTFFHNTVKAYSVR